MLEGQRANMLN